MLLIFFFQTPFFFRLRSARNPFVLPMQITHHRGEIHSPAGHKARPLFTSTDSDEYRASAALLRGSERRYSRSTV